MSRKYINILLGLVVTLETLVIVGLLGAIIWYFVGPWFRSPAEAATMPEHLVSEAMPVYDRQLAQGEFQNGVHEGQGTATIYQLADGSTVLRLADFQSTNGPDLHVMLTSHPAPTTQSDLMQNLIDLGPLKSTQGQQNYPLPPQTNVTSFKTVVIYCLPFNVVFSTAPLTETTP